MITYGQTLLFKVGPPIKKQKHFEALNAMPKMWAIFNVPLLKISVNSYTNCYV